VNIIKGISSNFLQSKLHSLHSKAIATSLVLLILALPNITLAVDITPPELLSVASNNDLIVDDENTCPLVSGVGNAVSEEGDITFLQHCLYILDYQQIHFEVKLSDNFSNAQSIQILYWLVNNEQHWITATRVGLTNHFEADISLNQYTASGVYNIRAIQLFDNQGVEVRFNEDQLTLLGLNTSVSFNNPNADITKPSPTTLTSSGWSINDNEQPTINFTVTVEDDLSGVQDRIILELNSPTGTSIQEYGTRIAENVYNFDFTLNKHASSGVYPVNTIRIYDNAGNLNHSQDWILNNVGEYELINPFSDSTLPLLSYINIEAKFDEESDRPIISVKGLSTDDVSGIKSVYLRLTRPNGGVLDKWQEVDSTSSLAGGFSSEIALPSIYENGLYSINYLRLIDYADNESTLYKVDIDQTNHSSITSINLYYPDDDISDTYIIEGSSFDDFAFGANRSNDHVKGFGGNDFIFTGNGDDYVEAGEGDDLVIGGSGEGDDTYIGEEGFDTLKYTSAVMPILVNFINGTASGENIDNDIFSGFEKIIAGQGDDVIITDSNDNIVFGFDGDDVIVASAGADELTGGEGQDEFIFNDFSQTKLSSFTTIVDIQAEDILIINGLTDNMWNSLTYVIWDNNLSDSITRISLENQMHFTTDGNDGYLITVLDINAKEDANVLKLTGINDPYKLSRLNKSSKDNDEDANYDYFDLDDDNDNVLDTADAFPMNYAASADTDFDGKPDSFHENCNDECIVTSGLVLDLDDDNDGILDSDDTYPLEKNFFSFDVNGDGKVSLPIDGFIILRSMVGFPASFLASNEDMVEASRTRGEMAELLNNAKDNFLLDINGDGKVSLPIDGFIILRHMVGFPASALASDEDMINATRTRDEMRNYMVGNQ
jgi:hypothetical protein